MTLEEELYKIRSKILETYPHPSPCSHRRPPGVKTRTFHLLTFSSTPSSPTPTPPPAIVYSKYPRVDLSVRYLFLVVCEPVSL